MQSEDTMNEVCGLYREYCHGRIETEAASLAWERTIGFFRKPPV